MDKNNKRHCALVAAAAFVLAGCASTQQGTASSTSPSSQAGTAAPTQPPVSVPATSARRLVLHMTGPKTVTEAKDWAAFKEEWRATFAEHAKEAGIAFAMHEGTGKPAGEAGTLLTVEVNDYRMVGIGARVFLGAMTGNAYINANARYTDLATGRAFGERAYNTTSSAWQGVFGKMTPQQVDAIATEVFSSFKTAAPAAR